MIKLDIEKVYRKTWEELYNPDPEYMINILKRYQAEWAAYNYVVGFLSLEETYKNEETFLKEEKNITGYIQKAGKGAALAIMYGLFDNLPVEEQIRKTYDFIEKPEKVFKKHLETFLENIESENVQRWYGLFYKYAPTLSKKEMLKLMFKKDIKLLP